MLQKEVRTIVQKLCMHRYMHDKLHNELIQLSKVAKVVWCVYTDLLFQCSDLVSEFTFCGVFLWEWHGNRIVLTWGGQQHLWYTRTHTPTCLNTHPPTHPHTPHPHTHPHTHTPTHPHTHTRTHTHWTDLSTPLKNKRENKTKKQH